MIITATPAPPRLTVTDLGGHRIIADPVPVDSLEAIAGPPAAMLIGAGSVRLSGFGALGDRSLYVVYDAIAEDTNYNLPARLGTASGDGAIRIQTTLGGTSWRARFDFKNGDQNKILGDASLGTIGRHAVCAYVRDGMTVAGVTADGVDLTGSYDPGDGMEDGPTFQLSFIADSSAMQPRIAAVYPAAHSHWQRTSILAWLMREAARIYT